MAFPNQQLDLDLASPDDAPVWLLGDPHVGPLWRLDVLAYPIAKLRLRLDLGGFLVEEHWDCAVFDYAAGGTFEPRTANFITQRIKVQLP